MSRAFVKESDDAGAEPLPELMVSPHRNFVTSAGHARIEATVERLQGALSEARAVDDRAAVARVQRDLRYWTERRRTAEVVPMPGETDMVRFGSTVLLEHEDGTRVRYQIVGEDEADPAAGKISYVSPSARLLLGAAAGDVVALVKGEAEILEIR
jgi:transcription elongation GreA/GreB family factor